MQDGRHRRLQTLVMATFLMVLAGPAAAADMVSAADIPSVTAALQAAGHRTTLRQDEDGVRYILVDEGDNDFSVDFDDCEDAEAATGCNMLIFNAVWDADDSVDAAFVNDYNRNSTLAHAFVGDDGTLNLTLSVTTRGGLPAANFAEVIAIWDASDKDLSDLLDKGKGGGGVIVTALSVR